ncbi:MAG: thiamine phosphate synthase [Beijerinckiaceae bacterium]
MPKAEIYLVTPRIADAEAFAPILNATIKQTGAASVLLRLAPADERTTINRVKLLAPVAQALGAAVLVEDDPTVAIRGGADGVHVTAGPEALQLAMEKLKPDRIVGQGALRLRHDAMEAGEAGVDYVMFGEPRLLRDGSEIAPHLPAVIEQASWWAPLFQTPCVAYAASAEAVKPLEATGAEFVALGPWAFDPQG